MSLLFDVLFAWKCKSTHHKLALDALRHLRAERAGDWNNLFLYSIETYLEGAKAPDDTFKDFRNHVLHVKENGWGGAIEATEAWYAKTVEALRARHWRDVVYSAGVLSHYFSDPHMPLHTGQSEAEGIVHRAAEWSIAKSYEELQRLLENSLGGYPAVEVPAGRNWLANMVREGAELAHRHYDALIEHYDIQQGIKDPPAGLDLELRQRIAPLIGRAAVGYARILDKAIEEAGVRPPKTNVTLVGVLAAMTIPLFWVTRKLADVRERMVVEAIYREYQETGKVLTALPEDDKTVRRLHAEEVLKVPLAQLDAQVPPAPGSKHEPLRPDRLVEAGPAVGERLAASPAGQRSGSSQPTGKAAIRTSGQPSRPVETATIPFDEVTPDRPGKKWKFHLDRSMQVVQAPSIGTKTAQRLARIRVATVADLLELDPDDAARRLAVQHITADTVRDWQTQAELACRIPLLRGHDAQMLVGCGVRDAEQLAAARPADLLAKVEAFLATPEGDRVLGSGHKPDLKVVREWVEHARHARPLKAA